MRFRLAAAVCTAALAVSTTACASAPSAVSSDRSPDAPTPNGADNSTAVCEGIYAFAMARADDNDPTMTAFDGVWLHPEKYSSEQRIAIRLAYFTKEEAVVRVLVAEATDPQLRAALQTYADGWAELAAVRTAAGPDSSQPSWQPVMDLCPGIQDRIFADLDALGK